MNFLLKNNQINQFALTEHVIVMEQRNEILNSSQILYSISGKYFIEIYSKMLSFNSENLRTM